MCLISVFPNAVVRFFFQELKDVKVSSHCSYLQAGDVPVEFEEFHLSEVQNMASEEKLEQVLTSMKNNKVAMKGRYIVLMCCLLHLSNYRMYKVLS